LKRRGVTLALLWQEYRAGHNQGYAYSWFCERYSDWRKRISATPRSYRDKKETAYEAARFAKNRTKGELIEIVDRSTGAKLSMLEDGRTG